MSRQLLAAVERGQHQLSDPGLNRTLASGLFFQFFARRRGLQRQVRLAKSDLERSSHRLELRLQDPANLFAESRAVLPSQIHGPARIRIAVAGETEHEQ